MDSEAEWHIPGLGGADYATACGLDGNDPNLGQNGMITPTRGQKITCKLCKAIWSDLVTLRLRATDFER